MVYIKNNSLNRNNNNNNPGPRPLNNNKEHFFKTFCFGLFKNKRFRQLTFYILILFLFGLTIIDVQKLIICYFTDNKEIDIKMNFNASMTMPNLTFCTSKNNAWSHFNETTDEEMEKATQEGLAKMPDYSSFLDNNNIWDYRMVKSAYWVVALIDMMEQDTNSKGVANSINNLSKNPEKKEVLELINKWLNEIKKRNVTFDEFRQKVGKETLRRFLHRFDRLDINKEENKIKIDIKITWLSMKQLCFQPYFDINSFIPISDQEVDCMSIDIHGRPSDESRFLEGKGRSDDGYFNEICMGNVYEAVMQVKLITTNIPDPNDPIETRCQLYGQKENTPRSELECYRRCRLELIRKLCNCTAPSLSHLIYEPKELEQFPICNYEQCDIGNSTESSEIINWDSTCECFPECTQRGATGVWLGLSALSIVQFLTFLLTRAHKKVLKRKNINNNNNNIDNINYGITNNRRISKDGTVHEMTNPSNNPLGGGFAKNPFGNKRK
ncbi:hypothetical protein Mgra_00002197 [Meloidogyne graminicola]|uniref:Amiloride-sensitive sodium channel n=1 Tax=Meloidogyne graminicola TaxID=189291 RepID=A0A8S9ZX92_9BILA|nr:hypothetical protein Mgra_00002197 [Meloidogyne graminicola]